MPKGIKGFQKGVSGNPAGRPKKEDSFANALEREADMLVTGGDITRREALARILYKKAASGDLKAIEMIMDRTDGKPRQSIDQTTKNLSVIISQEDADNVT